MKELLRRNYKPMLFGIIVGAVICLALPSGSVGRYQLHIANPGMRGGVIMKFDTKTGTSWTLQSNRWVPISN